MTKGPAAPVTARNIIDTSDGCGVPITRADPKQGSLGYYNGPTKIFPLGGGSPAINLGDNAAAVDAAGQRRVCDQRGNGDPRFVAGFTDIGSFEQPAFPRLIVDTVEDNDLRACTAAGEADCALRGALELANATQTRDRIMFDPRVFDVPRTIVLTRPLPAMTAAVVLDAEKTAGVVVEGPAGTTDLDVAPAAILGLRGIELRDSGH